MNRDKNIDAIKGFAILLMVLNHIYICQKLTIWVSSFHMPLFFIVSGFLWKKKSNHECIRAKFKSLMLPYFFWCFLFFVMIIPLNKVGISNYNYIASLKAIFLFPTDYNNLPFNGTLWFLPCLFITSVFYNLISSLQATARTTIIIMLSILGYAYSFLKLPTPPFSLAPFCTSILFFEIGNIFKSSHKKSKMSLKIICPLVLFHVVMSQVNGPVRTIIGQYNSPILYIINGVCGTLVCYFIFSVIPNCKWKNIFSWLGRNTMPFLCTNQFIIFISYKIFYHLPICILADSTVACKSFQFIVTVFVCVIASKMAKYLKINWIFGGR